MLLMLLLLMLMLLLLLLLMLLLMLLLLLLLLLLLRLIGKGGTFARKFGKRGVGGFRLVIQNRIRGSRLWKFGKRGVFLSALSVRMNSLSMFRR